MTAFWQMIPQVIQSLIVITAMGGLNVGGALAFKAHVAGGGLGLVFAGLGAWGLGAFLFLSLLRMQDLALVGMASSVIQVALVIAAGVLIFGETLSARQVLAVLVAVIAMTIAMLPGSAA